MFYFTQTNIRVVDNLALQSHVDNALMWKNKAPDWKYDITEKSCWTKFLNVSRKSQMASMNIKSD